MEAREVGLVGRVGAGQEFLAAYGAVRAADDAIAIIAPGVAAILAGVVEVVSSDAAVAVALTPGLTLTGASSFAALTDTPPALEAGAYYRADAAGAALEAVSREQVLSGLLTGLGAGSYPRVVVANGVRSLAGLTAQQLAAVFVRRAYLAAAVAIPFSPNQGSGWATILSLDVPAGWLVNGASRVDRVTSANSQTVYWRLRHGGATIGSGVQQWQLAPPAAGQSLSVIQEVTTVAAGTLELQMVSTGDTSRARPGSTGTFLVATPLIA